MNSVSRTKSSKDQLGQKRPKKSLLNDSAKERDIFQVFLNGALADRLNDLEEQSRGFAHIKISELSDLFFELWLDLKEVKGRNWDPGEDGSFLLKTLIGFVLIVTDKDKPSGIGSKSKDSDYRDKVTPVFERIDFDLKTLTKTVKDSWYTDSLRHHLALSALEFSRTYEVYRTLIKNEELKIEKLSRLLLQLEETAGNKKKATEYINRLVSKMRTFNQGGSDILGSWQQRIESYRKRQKKKFK